MMERYVRARPSDCYFAMEFFVHSRKSRFSSQLHIIAAYVYSTLTSCWVDAFTLADNTVSACRYLERASERR